MALPKKTGGEVLGVPTHIGKHRRGRPGRAGVDYRGQTGRQVRRRGANVVAGAPLVQEAGGDDRISLSDTHDKEPRALKLPTTTKLAVRQTPDDATTRRRLAELSEKLDADRRAYSSERCWSFGPADVLSKARSEAAAVQKKSMPKLKHLQVPFLLLLHQSTACLRGLLN